MEPRKIAVKLRRDPRETAERHSQANPLTLECTLASGEAVTETMELRAELHAAQTPATTPLAATAAVTMTSGSTGPWELEFSGAQMNQTVLPDASEDFWLVVYATNADDDLFTLGKVALTLTFDNVSQVTPSPPDPALFLDLGGTQWKTGEDYAVDDIVALDGSIYVCTADNTSGAANEPGAGVDWEDFWTLFSGGGGGTVNLSVTRTSNAVTITPSGGGTAAEIPQANSSNAGVITNTQHDKIEALGTMSTQSAANVAITGGSITGITDLAITDGGTGASSASDARANLGLGTLATQNGTFSGTSSGTNTGDQTIQLTGDVTGSGTGSFATTLANTAVTAGSYTLASITVDSKGRITAASNGSAGSGDVVGPASSVDNSVARFDLTTGKLIQGSSLSIGDPTTFANSVAIIVAHAGQTNSSLTLTPQGTGAVIVGAPPDGTATGGNARGDDAIDLQKIRAANTQVASGMQSAIVGGRNHTASGTRSACLGGDGNSATTGNAAAIAGSGNTAMGTRSVAISGFSTTVSGTDSISLGGASSSATAQNGVVFGVNALANRPSMHAHSYGQFSANGDAQRGVVVVRRQTTDATQTELTIDGATPTGTAAATSNRFILLNNQTVMADVYVVARSASGTNDAGYHRRVLITRDANAASTAITGLQTIGTDMETAGASAWDVTLAADTTNGSLQVLVTGAAGTNINWFAEIQFREVIRA